MKIAWDIDDTLWKIREDGKGQCPDYDLINVLRWFANNGDENFVWSAGGIDYAKQICWKLGIDHLVTVIPKGELNKEHPDNPKMDIAFDDCEVNIAKVCIKVKRPDYSVKTCTSIDCPERSGGDCNAGESIPNICVKCLKEIL